MYDRSQGGAFRQVCSAQAGRCVDKKCSDKGSFDKGRARQAALLAGTFGILLACSSNDSAPKTGIGGSGSVSASGDAGRPLPGEGFEATPDFDITNPQRPVPPREQLVQGVSTLNGLGGANPVVGGVRDAGTDAGADAGR